MYPLPFLRFAKYFLSFDNIVLTATHCPILTGYPVRRRHFKEDRSY